MIGSLDKSYNRPILVDEDHLRYLAGIVEERFCAVEFEIKTIDTKIKMVMATIQNS